MDYDPTKLGWLIQLLRCPESRRSSEWKWCCMKFPVISEQNSSVINSFRVYCKCTLGCHWDERDSNFDYYPWSNSYNRMTPRPSGLSYESTTIAPTDQGYTTDQLLRIIAYRVLLPIVILLVGICLVLGITLIVKSYMMKPVKHGLATAIRRRRRTGHCPDNHYIPPEEIRASVGLHRGYERKSLPPPEVLMAARARASQILHV